MSKLAGFFDLLQICFLARCPNCHGHNLKGAGTVKCLDCNKEYYCD